MATLKPPANLNDEMLAAMNVSREYLAKRSAEKARQNATAPAVGSPAPNFSAPLLGQDGAVSDQIIELRSLSGRPVGLLFGSYTCPIFRNQLARYEQIHRQLKSQVNFLCVYILEAHPEDGWRVPHNWEQDICFKTPQSVAERARIAHLCRSEQGLTIPIVMDTMDDTLLTRYAGSPERLYVIGADGTVLHRSAIGPFDMDDVQAWLEALKRAIAPPV